MCTFRFGFFICELSLTLPKKYILYVTATHLDLKRNAISSYVQHLQLMGWCYLYHKQSDVATVGSIPSILQFVSLTSAEKATQNISFESYAILFSLSVFVNIENSVLYCDVHCKKFSTLFTNYMKLCSKISKQFL